MAGGGVVVVVVVRSAPAVTAVYVDTSQPAFSE